MTQENHRNSMRLPQREARRTVRGPICHPMYCRGVQEQHPCLWSVSWKKKKKEKKKETKPTTNTELYWWESLVGNGITQAFNWMGLTFAEQGVVAFVSVLRHNLLPYTCIMLQWLRRGSFPLQRRKLTVTLCGVKGRLSTFQLMGNSCRHGGAARIKINERDQSAHTFSSASALGHSWLSASHKCHKAH